MLMEVEQSKIFTSTGVVHVISEAEFLDQIQTKVLRIFLRASQQVTSPALLRGFYFFKLTQPLTVSIVHFCTL
jgi:hypothetical protein